MQLQLRVGRPAAPIACCAARTRHKSSSSLISALTPPRWKSSRTGWPTPSLRCQLPPRRARSCARTLTCCLLAHGRHERASQLYMRLCAKLMPNVNGYVLFSLVRPVGAPSRCLRRCAGILASAFVRNQAMMSWRTFTGTHSHSRIHQRWRASGCRSPRRWPAVVRLSLAICPPSASSQARIRSTSLQAIATSSLATSNSF